VLFRFLILSDDGVYDSLEDVFFRDDAIHVFNKLVCLLGLIVFEVVNNEVKSGLRDHID
jgi:hypothetical protein